MGKFVEFFGPGVAQLSIADRATIANMCPEYGATAAFFPVDDVSIQYLEQTGECHTVQDGDNADSLLSSVPLQSLDFPYVFKTSL